MTHGCDRLPPFLEGIVKRRRIVARLNGLGDLCFAEDGRDRQPALRAAGFATIGDFDDAVRALRRMVRNRAVATALATLRRGERVLEAELRRYREPQAAKSALLRAARGAGADAMQRVLAEYPILRDTTALRAVLTAPVPDMIGGVLRQRARELLDSAEIARARLADDPDAVFGLDRVVDRVLVRCGLPPDSPQARLVAGRRATPGKSAREVTETVLGFAGRPTAEMAEAALETVGAARGVRPTRRPPGAKPPIARGPVSASVANGRSGELFALFTAVAGAPRRTLLPGEARLSAKAGGLLAAGHPLGFLPRTRFAAAGPAEIAAWHPDHPDCLIRLDGSGITWYRRADGAVGRVEYPHPGADHPSPLQR